MLDGLEQEVARFIRRHGLFAGAEGILIAASGGADSTALLHILHNLRVEGHLDARIVCAHTNHQLRGAASEGDEQFVIAQATRLGLSAVTRAVEVRAHARTHKLSLETAARQLRLTSLVEMARDQRCTWLSTGHQKNDNAETVIQRLRRGTGFRGLAGIRPWRSLGGLRFASPLLCVTRVEIVRYLEDRGLQWREDHTNVDIAYTRNYIRLRLLPFLQQEAQDSLIEELSELAAAAERLYHRIERETEEAWPRLVEPGENEVIIPAPELALLPELVAVELIRRTVAGLGRGGGDMTQLHYQSILRLAREDVGPKAVSLPNAITARREGGRVILSVAPLAPAGGVDLAPAVLQVPGKTRFAGREIEATIRQRNEIDSAKIQGDKNPCCEYLDLDQVEPPVVVRLRRAGDRFQPLGMTGEKKVGKFLTTAKTPRDARGRILIFADRERILWVCPVRISEQAKVTESTKRVLQLAISKV